MISLLLSLSLFVTSSLATCDVCAWYEYCDNGVCRDPHGRRSMDGRRIMGASLDAFASRAVNARCAFDCDYYPATLGYDEVAERCYHGCARNTGRRYIMGSKRNMATSCANEPDWTNCRQGASVGCCVDERCYFDNDTNAQCIKVQSGRMIEERVAARNYMSQMATSCDFEPDWTSCRQGMAVGCCVSGKCDFSNDVNAQCLSVQGGRMMEEREAARNYYSLSMAQSCANEDDCTNCRQNASVGVCIEGTCSFHHDTNLECKRGRQLEERFFRMEDRASREYF